MPKRTTALLFLLIGLGCSSAPLPILGEVPDFAFTDQTGKTIHRQDLVGKAWVVDFIYTGCSDFCPLMTEKMSQLRRKLQKKSGDIQFVSFSVDPVNDTPERLAAFARNFDVDPSQWFFLTGPMKEIEDTVVHGFKTSLGKGSDYQIAHSNYFVLVDRRARIRGYFDFNEKDGLEKIERAVYSVLKEP